MHLHRRKPRQRVLKTLPKSQLADHLGVSRARVSQYIAMGMPEMSDGRIHFEAALYWIRANINTWNNKHHDKGRWLLR